MTNPHAENDYKTLKILYPDRLLVFETDTDYEVWSLDALTATHDLGLPVVRHAKWDLDTGRKYVRILLSMGHKVALLERVQ